MGQKVSPIGMRVGVIRDWQSRWYADDKEFGTLLMEDVKIRELVEAYYAKLSNEAVDKRKADPQISRIEIERTKGLDLHPPGILSLPFPRAPWILLPAHLLFILPSLLWDHKQQGSWDTPLFILLLNGMMDDSMVLGVTFQLLLPEAGLDSGPCKQERHGCAGSVLGGQCGFCRGSAHTHTLHPCVPHPSPQRGAKVPVGLQSFLDLGPGPLPFFLFPSFLVSNFIPSHGCS